MFIGRIVLFAAGAAAVVALGYAATKSETAKDAAKATVRASLKAKDWAATKYEEAKEELKTIAKDARKEPEVEA